MTENLLHVIYDGRCAFCVRTLGVLGALGLRRRMLCHDSHRAETALSFPELEGRDVRDAMYVVVAGEPPYRGFYAFRRLLRASPWLWALLPLCYLPGAGLVGTRAYAWVARNRMRFGCRSDLCALPPGPRDRANLTNDVR